MNKIIDVSLEKRLCDCCGSEDLDNLWSNQSVVVKASATYRFRAIVVVCRKCGFCFNSPCYNSKELMDYYEDGLLGSENIGLPYSIQRRIDFIKNTVF